MIYTRELVFQFIFWFDYVGPTSVCNPQNGHLNLQWIAFISRVLGVTMQHLKILCRNKKPWSLKPWTSQKGCSLNYTWLIQQNHEAKYLRNNRQMKEYAMAVIEYLLHYLSTKRKGLSSVSVYQHNE